MKKAFSLFIILFVFPFGLERSELAGFQMMPLSSKKIEKKIDLGDSIFQRATNSPNYLIVKEKDFKVFKSNLENDLSDLYINLNTAETELMIQSDSIKLWKVFLEEAKVKIKNSEKFSFNSQSFFNLPIWLLAMIILFLGYSIFISLRFFSLYYQGISANDQLDIITKDFISYKKNTIEKERKLMRDLIDAKNDIEELRKELKE
jgi:hypothetical protein